MSDTPFLKSHDDLIEDSLDDFEGVHPGCDKAQASSTYGLSAPIASATWGLHRQIDKTAKEIFPDQCSEAGLEHHGLLDNYARNPGESLSAYRARYIGLRRNPESGVKESDYIGWATGVQVVHTTPAYTEKSQDVKAYENARGSGSGNIVIGCDRSAAHGGEEEPTAELLAAVTAAINAGRPWGGGSWDFLVIAWTKKTVNVDMTVSAGCDLVKTASDIAAHMRTLFGRTLYVNQLKAIAINNGDDGSVIVNLPASNVACETGPLVYERIWDGTIVMAEA